MDLELTLEIVDSISGKPITFQRGDATLKVKKHSESNLLFVFYLSSLFSDTLLSRSPYEQCPLPPGDRRVLRRRERDSRNRIPVEEEDARCDAR